MLNKIKSLAQLIGFIGVGLLAVYGVLLTQGGGATVQAARGEIVSEPEVAPQAPPLQATPAPGTFPGQFNYQGILRGADGNPIANGEYTITFRIYDGPGPTATDLWEEVHSGVVVRDGRFGVTLGYSNQIPTTIFKDSPDRFVGVTVDPFAEMVPRLRLSAVPYAFRAENAVEAENGVPVGTVIDWWRPDSSFSFPDNYQVCDGSLVNDPESPLYNTTLPDLTDKFIRGVTDVNAIGASGGSENHNHTGTTNSAGDHNHTWAYMVNLKWSSYNEIGNQDDLITWAGGMDSAGTGYYPLAVDSTEDRTYYTAIDGGHEHTTQTSFESHLPPYVGLLKLCRIK